jgi:very-short-patch-repair endonuclease
VRSAACPADGSHFRPQIRRSNSPRVRADVSRASLLRGGCGSGYPTNIRADARLVLLGYTVLRFDYQQIMFDWPHVESSIMGAVAQGLHLA